MNNKSRTLKEKILKGLELSQKKLIQLKKDRNLNLVISENGQVIKVPGSSLR